MAAQLRAEKPTGNVAYPLVLVEGDAKTGRSAASYMLSASSRVGRSFVFDMGEGTADEYAHLGPYEVVRHNGTFTDLRGQMRLATEVPKRDSKPNLIVLDDGTNFWDMLTDWTQDRARRGKANKEALARDPDAAIVVAPNLWNDRADRWWDIVNLLRMWDGIGIIICRGREVTKFDGERPVAGQTEYTIDAHKGTLGAVTAWVQMTRPHTATLMGLRSFGVEVPRGGLRLPDENPLEHLVFDIMGAGGFTTSSRVAPDIGVDIPAAKNRLIDTLYHAGFKPDDAFAEATKMWLGAGLPAKDDADREVSKAEVNALILAAAERIGPQYDEKIGAAA